MAAKEIKSISVLPNAEEDTINLWQSFGWELKSTQEVKTQDVQKYTGQDSQGTKYYETTKGDHYIKLTFERDPARQNYAELVELERQFYVSAPPSEGSYPEKPGKLGCAGIISIIALIIGIVCLADGSFTAGLVFALPGLAIVIWRIKSYSSREESYSHECELWEECKKTREEFERNRAEVLKKARALV